MGVSDGSGWEREARDPESEKLEEGHRGGDPNREVPPRPTGLDGRFTTKVNIQIYE